MSQTFEVRRALTESMVFKPEELTIGLEPQKIGEVKEKISTELNLLLFSHLRAEEIETLNPGSPLQAMTNAPDNNQVTAKGDWVTERGMKVEVSHISSDVNAYSKIGLVFTRALENMDILYTVNQSQFGGVEKSFVTVKLNKSNGNNSQVKIYTSGEYKGRVTIEGKATVQTGIDFENVFQGYDLATLDEKDYAVEREQLVDMLRAQLFIGE